MGNDLCIHWQPRSWHYPISWLLTVKDKAAQQALHCHSHTEASVPSAAAWTTTVCSAAQRLCREDALTSAPPQLHVDRSDITHAGSPKLHWGWVWSLNWTCLASGLSQQHMHMTDLLTENGLTRAQLCYIIFCSRLQGRKRWKCHEWFRHWHPEEFKFWGRWWFLLRQQEGIKITKSWWSLFCFEASVIVCFEQKSVAWRPQEPESFYVGTNQTWDDNNTICRLSNRAVGGVPPQAGQQSHFLTSTGNLTTDLLTTPYWSFSSIFLFKSHSSSPSAFSSPVICCVAAISS